MLGDFLSPLTGGQSSSGGFPVVVWSSGPLTTALLRRLGLDPDFTDEQPVVIGRIQ